MDLRPHQIRSINAVVAAMRAGKRRLMLQLPTGAGKTAIASTIATIALKRDKKLLFTVPALSLVDQTVQRFYSAGIQDIGVIQANHIMTDWSKPIQIASIQTLMKRGLPDCDVAIVDEAHIWFEYYERMFSEMGERTVIALSATPWTKGLGKHYDEFLIGATIQELVDAGYLSDFKVFAPSHPDLSGVRIVAGDYHEGDLSKAMDKPQLVGDVVDTWMRLGENRSTFAFGVDCAHARGLQEKFEAAGVAAAYMDAHTKVQDREAIFRRYRSGEVRVVCNVGVLTVGVDEDVRCLIDAAPTRSEMRFVQRIGRALRTAEAKDHAILIDHASNHTRLGFVTDIAHAELDMGLKREKAEARAPLPKECPKCTALRPPGKATCPNCGYKPDPPRSDVKHLDGDLAELSRSGGQAAVDEAARRRFYGELLQIAGEGGYSSGWVSHKFKEKHGDWPPRSYAGVPKIDPTIATRSWVKSRQIAFIKAREKASLHADA